MYSCVRVFLCSCVRVRVLHDVEDGVLQLDGVETLPPASHCRVDVEAGGEDTPGQLRSNPNPSEEMGLTSLDAHLVAL